MKTKQETKQTKKDAAKKLRQEKLAVMRRNADVTSELAKLWVVK